MFPAVGLPLEPAHRDGAEQDAAGHHRGADRSEVEQIEGFEPALLQRQRQDPVVDRIAVDLGCCLSVAVGAPLVKDSESPSVGQPHALAQPALGAVGVEHAGHGARVG